VGYGGSELESGGELFGLRRDRTVMGRTDLMGGVLDQRLSRERERLWGNEWVIECGDVLLLQGANVFGGTVISRSGNALSSCVLTSFL
jgi:hypothetical protein